MDFRHLVAAPASLSSIVADALLLVVHGEALDASLEPALATLIDEAVESGDFQLKAGKTLYVHRPAGFKAGRLLVVGAAAAGVKSFKAAVATGLAQLKGSGAKHVAVAVADVAPLTALHGEALTGSAADATYVYRHTKPSAPKAPAMTRFTLVCGKDQARDVAAGLQRGAAIAAGVTLARECANRPGNVCTPTYLGEQAKRLGKEHGLKVQVLDRKAVEKLGMGSFLAVAQGSSEPLRFIVARYEGAPKSQAPVVLVGKGITFDTGGISIKPSAEMDEMKYDMGGAASVLGTLRAVAELQPKLNLIGIIPSCDNMPSGHAVKPGDVVTSLSGQTIEILNTDAEGRL
ncbi:MAG: leucyl aminopeptidase, partial [Burkholderiaceae bacterium]|nr:leucyl aminopeptidase [Burkholderiaceae bacterium]